MNELYINGIKYDTADNWSISEKSGSPTCSQFNILVKENQNVPMAGDLVSFQSGGNTLFLGVCELPKGTAFSSGNELQMYCLKCNNGNRILSNRLPNISYENKTLSYIVDDLFDEYIAAEGYTKGRIEIQNDVTFEAYNSNQIALGTLLDELAQYVNAVWECTPGKVFNFYSASSYPSCEVTLNESNAALSAVSASDESNSMRTRQIIEGAITYTSAQTETFTKTVNENTFATVYPLSAQPVISINGTVVSPSEIGVKNLSAELTSVLFFWSYDSELISINPEYTGSTSVPTGATIVIVYSGLINIRIEIDNAAKINEIAEKTGTSGIIENYCCDSSLQTPQDAYAKANALLLAHGRDKKTLTATTTTEILTECGLTFAETAVGSLWHVSLPRLRINGDYVITERTLTQNVKSDDTSYNISLKWTDNDFSGGYANTLKDIETSQTKLSVRKNLRIIKYINNDETTKLGEDLVVGGVIINYCGTDWYNGQQAVPFGSMYPYVTP